MTEGLKFNQCYLYALKIKLGQRTIVFRIHGDIVVSSLLESPEVLGIDDSLSIRLCSEYQTYMAFHRDNVFEKVLKS